eukprot:s3770_g1.t2
MQGGHAHGENPTGSHAWQLLNLGSAFEEPVLKPTRIVTTDVTLANSLREYRCPGHPGHAHLEGHYHGRPLTAWAEHYPTKLCKLVARAMRQRNQLVEPSDDVFLNTDSEADSETEDLLRPSESIQAEAGSQAEQGERKAVGPRAMIQKLPVNTGHSSNEQMLRLAHRAKASGEVTQAIKEFKRSVCEELQVPPSRRTAALSHTETPNHIVGLDIVQVELKKDTPNGVVETKFNIDFAQQYEQGCLVLNLLMYVEHLITI